MTIKNQPAQPQQVEPADILLALDWAERDQDESRQCGDEEAEANLAALAELREKIESGEFRLMCCYCLNEIEQGHQSDCEKYGD